MWKEMHDVKEAMWVWCGCGQGKEMILFSRAPAAYCLWRGNYSVRLHHSD